MLAAQDIAIDRLRIKAEPRVAQQLARELAQATWPLTLPVNVRDAWVFVRELRVQGKALNLRQQSAQALESVLARTVDGRLAAAEHAQAVRFATLPQLLAFLLRDLAQGNAIRKWYWARWSYLLRQPRDQAVAQLLVDNLEHIAAVVAQLNSIGELTRVWNCITQPAAGQIIRQMEQKFRGAVSSAIRPNSADVQTQIFHHAQRHWLQLKQQGFAVWSATLANISGDDQRVKLAAIVSALEYCPLLLMRDTSAVVKAFAEVMLGDTIESSPTPENKISNSVSVPSTPAAVVDSKPNTSSATIKNTQETEDFSSTDKSDLAPAEVLIKKIGSKPYSVARKTTHSVEEAADNESKQSEKSTSYISGSANDIAIKSVNAELPTVEDIVDESDKAIALGSHFYTQAGGIFYFINAISWLLKREQMLSEDSSGWLWLYDLARLFEQHFAPEKESCLDLPLTRFIAHAAGMDLDSLNSKSPDETIRNLFALVQARFSEKSFWTMSEQSLLLIPAQVVTSPSHLDIYFSLSSVRLDVRLTGLDVNPGWVPWLGRVVHFHYVDSPSEMGGGNHE